MADDMQGDPLPASNTSGAEVPLPTENTSGAEVSIPGYRPSGYQDSLEDARTAGYPWSEIRGHIAQGTAAAADVGYNDAEIDAHLGFAEPAGFERDARNGWAKQMAQNPELLTGLTDPDPKVDLSLSSDMAADYTQALLDGEVKGPQDFARRYAAAALNAAHELHGADGSEPEVMAARRGAATVAAAELAAKLPSREDLADATVALGGGQQTRERLMEHWADTGTQPLDAAVQARSDPTLADKLFAAPVAAADAVGDFLKDIGVGFTKGFAYPDEEFRNAYEMGGLREALRQGVQPDMVERFSAVLTRTLTSIPQNYISGLLQMGPEVTERALKGEGFSLEEAASLAQYALTAPAGRFPGGYIRPEPEILPPQRPTPGLGLPPREPIIIEHQPAGPLVKLPPPPDLEVLNPEAPLGTPREMIPARDALGPVPAEVENAHADAQALSDMPVEQRAVVAEKPVYTFEPKFPEFEANTLETGVSAFRLMRNGEPVAEANVSVTGTDARVNSISTNISDGSVNVSAGIKNLLGPREMRAIARAYFEANPEINTISGLRVTGSRALDGRIAGAADSDDITITREQIMGGRKPVMSAWRQQMEAENRLMSQGVPPELAVTSEWRRQLEEGGRTLEEGPPAEGFWDKLRRSRDEAITNEVMASSAPAARRRYLESLIPKDTTEPFPAPKELEPKELIELAEGYDTAKSLYHHFSGILGDLLADESGALTWHTPKGRQFWNNFAVSRDIAHSILIPNIQKGVKNDVLLSRMMDSYRGAMAPHVNEFARASRAGDGQAMIDSEIGKFLGYVENRTWGGTLRNSRLQPVADALAAIAQHGEKAMADAAAEGLIDVPTLISNWYKHLWKNPHGVNWDNLTGGYSGVQGNASFTRQRSLPTTYDGMKAGLSPMFDNPIDQALYGEHLRSHYLNALRSIKEAMNADQVYWGYGPREVGDIRLDGTAPKETSPLGTYPGGPRPSARDDQFLYGQPGFARPYNNMLAMGMNAHPVGASAYQRLLWAGNMSTAVKLLWPGFHMRVIGLGTLATGAATMLDEVGRLEFGKAFASALKTVVAPATLGEQMWKGFRSVYRYNRDMKDPVLDLLDSAGLRITPRQSIYHVGAESLMETAKRGGFQPTQGRWDVLGGVQEIFRTIGRDIQATTGDPRLEGTLHRMFRFPDRAIVQLPLTELGRVMQTATSPIFDYYIPAAKAGAGYVRMQSWLDKNRFATDEQKWFQARQIVRDVENRFGELNQDTLFGPKMAKQIANVAMVSTGWKYGSWRGFLGAIGIDVERGGRLGKLSWNSINTNALVGAVAVYSMFNAVEQVAHGQPPFWKTGTAISDLANARIGGSSKWGGPARLMDPAELKEIYDAAKVVLVSMYSPKDGPTAAAEYAMNALNPFWHALYGTLSGRDGISPQARSVYDRPGGYPEFLKETFGPIVYQQLKDARPGSALSKWEIFMGTREASKWVTDWNVYLNDMAKGHAYTTKQEIRRDNKLHGGASGGHQKKENAGERQWRTGR